MPHSTTVRAEHAAKPSSAPVAVNPAFLSEIKEINQALADDIGRLQRLAACPSVIRRHARAFVRKLETLRDDLAMHFSLEEFFGYLDDPVAAAPRLCERADGLRQEHSILYEQLCGIVESAQQLSDLNHLARLSLHVPRRLRAFLDRLAEHESRENELILEAFCDDVGVGD